MSHALSLSTYPCTGHMSSIGSIGSLVAVLKHTFQMAYNTSYGNVSFKNCFENNFFPFNFLCKQFFFFKIVVQTIFFLIFLPADNFFYQIRYPPLENNDSSLIWNSVHKHCRIIETRALQATFHNVIDGNLKINTPKSELFLKNSNFTKK